MAFWEFLKFFIPYLFLFSGLVLVIAGMSDIGYVAASPTCAEWKQANHEYSRIQDSSSVPLPNLHLTRFSTACGLWKSWFSFAIMAVFGYFTLLIWPIAFTVGRKVMFISMEIVATFSILASILAGTFAIVFFTVGGAFEWDFLCSNIDNVVQCAFFDGDGIIFPASPLPSELPWEQASQAFRDILVDPKFFARYALDIYAAQDLSMTITGCSLGGLGAFLMVILQWNVNKEWSQLPHPVVMQTSAVTTPNPSAGSARATAPEGPRTVQSRVM